MSASVPRFAPDGTARPTPPPGAVRRAADDSARRAFLRLVSHELRTPLNAILGFSEIIATELYGPIGEPRYREHAELVHTAGLKLSKLVNDVIELARLQAGLAELDLRPEEPVHVLESAIRTLRPDAEAKPVRLVLLGAADDLVRVDSRAIKTVMSQLVLNAIAASPVGAAVELSAHAVPGEVVLQVADHGPGVPQRHIPRLLRPFEQAENALTRQGEGAGLGLPIARLYTEAMGGKLRLHSRPGEGLRACVHLPAVCESRHAGS